MIVQELTKNVYVIAYKRFEVSKFSKIKPGRGILDIPYPSIPKVSHMIDQTIILISIFLATANYTTYKHNLIYDSDYVSFSAPIGSKRALKACPTIPKMIHKEQTPILILMFHCDYKPNKRYI